MATRVIFLGTGSTVPTSKRGQTSIFCDLEGERILLDCGEGTQRQIMRFGAGFGISHIFLTQVQGSCAYGLPGLLSTMDFRDRDASVTVFVPPGMSSSLETFITSVGERPSYPLRIREVGYNTVVTEINRFEIRTIRTNSKKISVGYILDEKERKGRFNREKVEELGIPVGPKFSQLHEGQSVELEDGRVIKSEQVVGPPRPGRKIVYSGQTRPSVPLVKAAEDADLLIHDASFSTDLTDIARELKHSTVHEAATVAAQASVKRLAMVHISSQRSTNAHQSQAREVFDGESFVPNDGEELEVPYPEEPDTDTTAETDGEPQQPIETNDSQTVSAETAADGSSRADVSEEDFDPSPPDRRETHRTRIIRDTQLVNEMKEQYSYQCQVCGEKRLRTLEEGYAEGHHLKPLGEQHNGPDIKQNIIILCPNHHADFDHGLIRIDPDTLELTSLADKDVDGSRLDCDHRISREFIEYHNTELFLGE